MTSLRAALAPFTADPPASEATRSSRGRARRRFHRSVVHTANEVLSALGSLAHVDTSGAADDYYTAAHHAVRKHVWRMAGRYVSRCWYAGKSGPDVSPSSDYVSPAAGESGKAVPLVASQVDLPDSPPTLHLLDALPPDVAEVLSGPQHLLRPGASTAHSAFRSARFYGERDQYVLLVRRLLAAGLVRSVPEDGRVRARADLFAVPKGGDRQRLIVNGRPQNAMFRDPPNAGLPNPSLVAEIEVAADGFVASKTDLRDYYFTLRMPEWLQFWFGLPLLTEDEAAALGLDSRELIWVCLPMGFSWSVLIGQLVHLHVVGPVRPGTELLAAAAPPVCVVEPSRSLYIDDCWRLGRRSEVAALAALQARDLQAYERSGLRVSPKKCSPPTSAPLDILGLEFHGAVGEVSPSWKSVVALRTETEAVLRRGSATGNELRAVVGKWLWSMLLRRPALAVFSSAFTFCNHVRRRAPLWHSVTRELVTALGLLPLLVARLSAPWARVVLATDASDSGLGVVSAQCEPEVCRTLAAELPRSPPRERALQPPAGVLGLQWKMEVSAPWPQSCADAHINPLEAFALTIGVRRALEQGAGGKRVLALVDSSAVLGAALKGRSGAPSLRGPIRVLAAWLLGSGVALAARYVPSEFNPADAASRRFA